MTERKFKTADDLRAAGVEDPKWFVAFQIAKEIKDYSLKDVARMVSNGITVDVEAWLDDQYECLEEEAEEIIEADIEEWVNE